MRVAVTAVGGGVGQSVLKSLRDTEYEAVAIDPSIDAMGLYFAKHAYLSENVKSPRFIDRLIEICKETDAKILFSGLDLELEPLSLNKERFLSEGITPIVSDMSVVKLSNDKKALSDYLAENGFPVIKTALSVEEAMQKGIDAPILFKPRVGARSMDVKLFKSWPEAQSFIDDYKGEYVLQEYIEGDEYTCGSVTFEGENKGIIVMRRILRDGDTYKAYVEDQPAIESFLKEIIAKIKPFGPCNFQLRLKNDTPYLFEINARCSGTTGARTLAGFNEPLMICNYLTGKPIEYQIKPIAILRYWNEHVVDYSDMERLKNEGSLHRA